MIYPEVPNCCNWIRVGSNIQQTHHDERNYIFKVIQMSFANLKIKQLRDPEQNW